MRDALRKTPLSEGDAGATGYAWHWQVFGGAGEDGALPGFGHSGSDGTLAVAPRPAEAGRCGAS